MIVFKPNRKNRSPAAVIPAKAGIQSLDLKIIFNSSFPQKRESGSEKWWECIRND
ncbi:hypothetical protein NEIPOLOT_01083 [Neisseria polysaccharea ATCC 43768]|nr:hypothetical protein NEIPOLOT_01083 [Neisseria polysaccharea ATCC 43768]